MDQIQILEKNKPKYRQWNTFWITWTTSERKGQAKLLRVRERRWGLSGEVFGSQHKENKIADTME